MDDSIPRVCLLGGFSVVTEDGVVEERAWRLRKAKALVKLLALAPERRLHRERLADLLWPDRDAQAVAALQRALVVDPLAEPAHRALMRVYAATGRRQQALAQYQLLRQQLDAELAAEPDPETRDLYRALLAPEPATETRGNLPRP